MRGDERTVRETEIKGGGGIMQERDGEHTGPAMIINPLPGPYRGQKEKKLEWFDRIDKGGRLNLQREGGWETAGVLGIYVNLEASW